MRRGIRWVASVFAFASVSVLVPHASAQSVGRDTITVQARLTQGGVPVTNPALPLTLEVVDTPSGPATVLFSETPPLGVNVQNGVLAVRLGETTALPAGLFGGAGERYVAIKSGGVEIVSPRIRLTAVPYALALSTPGGGTLDAAGLDARFVNAAGDSSGPLSVNGTTTSAALSANAGGGGQNAANFNGSVLITGNVLVFADVTFQARLDVGGALKSGPLHVLGNITATGTKSFVVPNPSDPTRVIAYASLEGPEAAMYCRGSAALAAGTVTVQLPEHFALLAEAGSVTVQVTPSAECNGLFVSSRSLGAITVRELAGGTSSATFDYVVMARRAGVDFQVDRSAGQ